MESIENIGKEENAGLVVEDQAKVYLKETAKWSNFLAIVGLVMSGLFMLMGIGVMIFMGSIAGASEDPNLKIFSGGFGIMYGLIYILIAAFYVYPCLKLYGFAKKTKASINLNDSFQLTEALSQLNAMFKFMGILTIIVLALYLLIILVAMGVGLSSIF
ncbi:MAG: hypothetical protein IPO92_12150 [Saprospiraceae bacterium]|nr:hypothetical protein [Saprospiraceae bacterium]